MTVWTETLASVVLVSLVSLTGVAGLSSSPRRLRRIAAVLVAFAAGTLLGDAFIHLPYIGLAFVEYFLLLALSLFVFGVRFVGSPLVLTVAAYWASPRPSDLVS
jgi:hypothetical protein